VFTTKLNVLIPIFLHPDGLNLGDFKLRLFDLTEFIVLKSIGHRHWVEMI